MNVQACHAWIVVPAQTMLMASAVPVLMGIQGQSVRQVGTVTHVSLQAMSLTFVLYIDETFNIGLIDMRSI